MIKQVQRNELYKHLLAPECHERNILKLCEEMTELQEVLLKWVNKQPENRPPLAKIIEELGDVNFRADVLMRQMNIDEEVLQRSIEKEEQIYNWYKEKEQNTILNGS